jgi:hypothetical protein
MSAEVGTSIRGTLTAVVVARLRTPTNLPTFLMIVFAPSEAPGELHAIQN